MSIIPAYYLLARLYVYPPHRLHPRQWSWPRDGDSGTSESDQLAVIHDEPGRHAPAGPQDPTCIGRESRPTRRRVDYLVRLVGLPVGRTCHGGRDSLRARAARASAAAGRATATGNPLLTRLISEDGGGGDGDGGRIGAAATAGRAMAAAGRATAARWREGDGGGGLGDGGGGGEGGGGGGRLGGRHSRIHKLWRASAAGHLLPLSWS